MQAEKCIICGKVALKGLQLCEECMKRWNISSLETTQSVEELKDIADVFAIIDSDIKKSTEAFLRIMDRLKGEK